MSTTANLQQLFSTATDAGLITGASAQIALAPDIGAQINAGLGVSVDDIDASETFLVGISIDDSGSIRFGSNAQLVRDGHNRVIRSLRGAKTKNGILATCKYFNDDTFHYPFVRVEQAIEMTSSNYNPSGGTPLYDQTAIMLSTVLAKYLEFANNGVTARTATCIITDGDDTNSQTYRTAAKLRPLVTDMLMRETHIIAAIGIDDGGNTDFRKVFREMGIEDRWILTPANSETEIRRALDLFSQSAVQASQGGASFSQAAIQGFTQP